MKIFSRVKAAARAFSMVFARGLYSWLLPRTRYDYARQVGDGTASSVVMPVVLWIARTFPEAPIKVEDADGETVVGHAMTRLIKRPNPFYSGRALWMATSISFNVDGNAYWMKIRNRLGGVIQLWYVPHWMIRPISPDDGSKFISHYEYAPNGRSIPVRSEDVVHFRYGLDPNDPRLGLAPLRSQLREIFSDDEAANFSASLLRNAGVPGLLVSPANDTVTMSQDDLRDEKEFWKQVVTGDKRGEPVVMRGPTKIEQFGFSPEQMSLRNLRRLPEERVSAALGVPAIVAGLGAGLDRSTFANYAEAREAAYESNIVPTQQLVAEELENQLLPDFEGSPQEFSVGFDLRNVRILQDDENKLAERVARLVDGGIIMRSEGRQKLGFESDPEDEVYYIPVNLVVTPTGESPQGQPAADATAGQDGGGEKRRKAVKMSAPIARLMRAFARDADHLSQVFAGELERQFVKLAQAAQRAYLAHSQVLAGVAARSNGHGEKADEHTPQDHIQSEQIASEVGGDWLDYKPHYVRTFAATVESLKTVLNIGVNLTDKDEIDIVAEGGKRVGLIDLHEQTRDAVFRALSEGREAGEGADALARRIRDHVEAGPWSSVEVRSRVIARTETKYAQNISSVRAYRAADGVGQVEVIDAQLGPTDEECEQLNGEIVSFERADVLANEEHPNGTRSFAPVFGS